MQTVPVTAGGTTTFELPYQVAGVDGEQLRLAVTQGSQTLYTQTVPVVRLTQARVWQTARPLYKQLWGVRA